MVILLHIMSSYMHQHSIPQRVHIIGLTGLHFYSYRIQPQENKEKESDEEDFPAISGTTADDYPDGGRTAWCVALGVSE